MTEAAEATVSHIDETNKRESEARATTHVSQGRARTSVSIGPDHAGSAAAQVQGLFNQYEPLGNYLPWEILDYVELLATYNPDYSQAVDNIRTLANSGHELFVRDGSKRREARVKDFLEIKARSIQKRHGGIDGLIDKLLNQGAVFGAIAGEWVLNDDLTEVIDFVEINPKEVRFFWEKSGQRWVPFQKVSPMQAEEAKRNGQKVINNCVELNEETFHYYAFNAAPASPYGTPPFIAALANISIQRDMVHNMSQIVKKLGLLGMIDITIERLSSIAGETEDQFESRARGYLQSYATALEEMARDGGIVHFDDVEMKTTQLAGNAAGATNIFKQNEELIFSGLKSMPSVQGRSYCVVPGTRVLTADLRWETAGSLAVGDELIGFDEDLGKRRGRGASARMKSSVVERNERIWLDCVRVETTHGIITVSKQHPLVALDRSVGREWREAADLRIGDQLSWFGEVWEEDRSYESGYLAGFLDGEGSMGKKGDVAFAQKPGAVLDEAVRSLKELGFQCTVGEPKGGKNKDVCGVKLLGGAHEGMRLLGSVRPLRLLQKARRIWEGRTLRRGGSVNQSAKADHYATVTAVVDVGEQEVVALQTSSRTFIAEGLLNHNSTTETYAGVAYDIIIRNTLKYQRAVKRIIEAGYWLMCTLEGETPTSINIKFNDNKTLQRLHNAQSEQMEIRNMLLKWSLGIIDQARGAQELGYSSVAVEYDKPPVSENAGNTEVNDTTSDGETATFGALSAEFVLNELKQAIIGHDTPVPKDATPLRQDEEPNSD